MKYKLFDSVSIVWWCVLVSWRSEAELQSRRENTPLLIIQQATNTVFKLNFMFFSLDARPISLFLVLQMLMGWQWRIIYKCLSSHKLVRLIESEEQVVAVVEAEKVGSFGKNNKNNHGRKGICYIYIKEIVMHCSAKIAKYRVSLLKTSLFVAPEATAFTAALMHRAKLRGAVVCLPVNINRTQNINSFWTMFMYSRNHPQVHKLAKLIH